MFKKKKYILRRIYKFISKFISPYTQQEIEDKCKLKNYFIYLDYVRNRSLNIYTNRLNIPFSDTEQKTLEKIAFNLSPAAQQIILINKKNN
jgi:hypothetical protein